MTAMLVAGCSGSKHPGPRSSSPTSSTRSSLTGSPSSSPPGPPGRTGCPGAAASCDTFAGAGTGWGATNQTDYYYGYSSFSGGTYRVGTRTTSTVDSDAPQRLRVISPDYGVRVDVDALLNPRAPAGSGVGITCWSHDTADGSISAFVFFVYADHVKIALWAAPDGHPVDVAARKAHLLIGGTTFNHLTASCVRGTSADGKPEATLTLSVNGSMAVAATYGTGPKDAPWSVSDGKGESQAGVLAVGKDADAFFDNFALTPTCQPSAAGPCPGSSGSATTSS
jgi:hypothetical protein